MRKEKIKKCFIEIGLCSLQVLFCKISLFNFSFSLGFPFALVRLFNGSGLAIVAIEYTVANILYCVNFQKFILLGYEIVVLSLYYFSLEFIKTKRKNLIIVIFLLISKSLLLYFALFNTAILIAILVQFLIELTSIFYFKQLFISFKKKFAFYRFSKFDYLLFSLFSLLVFMGLFTLPIKSDSFVVSITLFLIVFICKIMPADKFLFLSMVLFLCVGLATNNLLYILCGIVIDLVCISFVMLNKYVYFVACIVSAVACIFIKNGANYNFYDFFVIIPIFICVFIPNKIYIKLSSLFWDKQVDFALKSFESNKINEIKNKLKSMSKTFFLMKENFKYLIVGKINRKSAALELSLDVMKKCCEVCPNYRICSSSNIERRNIIADNIVYAIERGKIYVEELGGGIKSYCNKSNVLVNEINAIAGLYLSYEKSVKHEDESKLLIASELENFAKIFDNFAKMTENSSENNRNLSLLIKDSLINGMVEVYDVSVIENKKGIERIEIVADNELAVRKELVEGIRKVTRWDVKLKEISHLEYSGLSKLTFIPENELSVQFAVCTSAKEKVNGDNLNIVKISDTKYFVAIADGMGHGKNANKISKMVLDLVMSMFSVGMDLDLIIETVNKLLLPVGLDNFSTLDACVVDLNENVATFIKLGSSVSILKHKMTSEEIVCKSLPVGIVQNIKPTITQKRLVDGDVIFLASDGVVDAFGDVQKYKNFINDAKIINLQCYIDAVMADIEASNPKHPDDMSIIAVKLLKNSVK